MAPSKGAHAAPNPSRNQRSRQVRAFLASGLVLGVGATLTLASWNDAEYAGAEVEAGFFEVQGSTTGEEGSFTSSSEGAPHSLTFAPEAEQMYPGLSTYALFSIRARPGSLGGTVRVQPPQWDRDNPDSLGEHLEYAIRVIDGTTCDTTTFGASSNVVVESGTSLTNSQPAENEQELASNAESAVNYCLQLTLPVGDNNEAQGQSVSPQWQFLGSSTVDE